MYNGQHGYTTLAYISLRPKNICVGFSRWLRSPTPQLRVEDTNMLGSENDKICINPNANAKICVIPIPTSKREQVEYRLRWVNFIRIG